jgi:cytochrome c peroxidase
MKRKQLLILVGFISFIIVLASFKSNNTDAYGSLYREQLNTFKHQQSLLLECITQNDLQSAMGVQRVKEQIIQARYQLKGMDFWLRYLEPLSYKKINSPLPVEWETEVFEKFEKPYKREGAGLTLAALYIEEPEVNKDSLINLIKPSLESTGVYQADSITQRITSYHHFFLCNRLFLLNLAAIYSTGFECPDTAQIIPELRVMLNNVNTIYLAFNESYTSTPLSNEYLSLYQSTRSFVNTQPGNYSRFDHFTFLRDYVNPLFAINQQLIRQYQVVSKSLVDFSLNKTTPSIFHKSLYNGQNPKGIFLRVKDEQALADLEQLGRLLFFDPVLSGNNMRSCASCHKPGEYFTDTLTPTSLQFNKDGFLPRNSPSLINAQYNHLIMADGKHISLQHQTRAVINNPTELGTNDAEALNKILSCKDYKKILTRLLAYTPQEKEITMDHVNSSITFYYSKFSSSYAPFDEAMNKKAIPDPSVVKGFNLFMSKAQCATCHFVPFFNGVKPPYIGSEFEVLGVPADTGFKKLSADKGRYEVNPACETMNAFRTGTLRNAAYTQPYMHNGVFKTLNEVIGFYDTGGGAGRGLAVKNQTLSPDSLHLTREEKDQLISFIQSLTENIHFEEAPAALPVSSIKTLNTRKVGGIY